MRSLIQKLSESTSGSPEVVLIIGAGKGTDLASLRRLDAKRLVLVEANPRLAEMLSQRIDPGRGEQVLSLAVTADQQQEAVLHIVNHPQHSSLAPPEGLLGYFQNLHVTEEVGVRARSLADIIRDLDLKEGSRHLLVLDAPGVAEDLLAATPMHLVQRFDSVLVRGGVEPLYAGESPLSDVLATLGGWGFDVVGDDPEAIFPHCSVLLARNDANCRALEWEQRVQALKESAQAQIRQQDELRALVQTLTQERDAAAKKTVDLTTQLAARAVEREAETRRIAELTASLQAKTAEVEAQVKLVTDRQGLVQKLTQERDAAAKQAADLKTQLDSKVAEHDSQAKLAADRQALVQKLMEERDAAAKAAADLKAQLDASVAERGAQAKLAEDRLADLAEFRQVVALSVRMQTLRESDLKDLQTRYEAVHQRSEEQHQLLSKLAERLRIASGYFHQLSALPDPPASRALLADAERATPRIRKSEAGPAAEKSPRKPVAAPPDRKKEAKSKPSEKEQGEPVARRTQAMRKGD